MERGGKKKELSDTPRFPYIFYVVASAGSEVQNATFWPHAMLPKKDLLQMFLLVFPSLYSRSYARHKVFVFLFSIVRNA